MRPAARKRAGSPAGQQQAVPRAADMQCLALGDRPTGREGRFEARKLQSVCGKLHAFVWGPHVPPVQRSDPTARLKFGEGGGKGGGVKGGRGVLARRRWACTCVSACRFERSANWRLEPTCARANVLAPSDQKMCWAHDGATGTSCHMAQCVGWSNCHLVVGVKNGSIWYRNWPSQRAPSAEAPPCSSILKRLEQGGRGALMSPGCPRGARAGGLRGCVIQALAGLRVSCPASEALARARALAPSKGRRAGLCGSERGTFCDDGERALLQARARGRGPRTG